MKLSKECLKFNIPLPVLLNYHFTIFFIPWYCLLTDLIYYWWHIHCISDIINTVSHPQIMPHDQEASRYSRSSTVKKMISITYPWPKTRGAKPCLLVKGCQVKSCSMSFWILCFFFYSFLYGRKHGYLISHPIIPVKLPSSTFYYYLTSQVCRQVD